MATREENFRIYNEAGTWCVRDLNRAVVLPERYGSAREACDTVLAGLQPRASITNRQHETGECLVIRVHVHEPPTEITRRIGTVITHELFTRADRFRRSRRR